MTDQDTVDQATEATAAVDAAQGHVDDEAPAGGCGGGGGCGGCGGGGGCGGHTRVPVLDARTIDPVIRQSAIFGVLVGLPPQGTVSVLTDQDPAPIAELLHERLPGEYEVTTEPVDEDDFKVTFTRF